MSFSQGNARCLGGKLWSRLCAIGMLLAVPMASRSVRAEENKPSVVATPTALPQRGALASSTDRGFGAQRSPSQWGGLELEGKSNPPITASVFRGKRADWELKVFNNSEDVYSVTVSLEQLEKSGARLRSDSFTFSLRAGEQATRSTPAHARSTGAVASLVSWRKTAKKAPQESSSVPPVGASPGIAATKPKSTVAPSGFEDWLQRSGG